MTYRIAAADCETDPFQHGRIPAPFVVGFWDGDDYREFWGPDCFEQFIAFLRSKPKLIIYFHNGGKFDYHFMLDHFSGAIKIINARIVKAKVGKHEFRDSYAILPAPLRTFGGKLDIDYRLMEAEIREQHRAEISHYLKADCTSLFNAVKGFCAEFSPKRPPRLTMASTAMAELRKLHRYDRMTQSADEFIRPYFFGGRCQCFETGIVRGNFTVYDVNSMYPNVMRNTLHPISAEYTTSSRISKQTFFLTVEAENHGAFAQRLSNNALSFTEQRGVFNISIHEYNAAIETGTASKIKILRAINFAKAGTFAEFVDHFYGKRMHAKDMNWELLVIFYKFILNGAYGKFAQNCADFMDYRLERGLIFEDGWELAYAGHNYFIYERPARLRLYGYYNVATGASITGAARAQLLRGIARANRPVYSDTDSIICVDMAVTTDAKQLGAWKVEGKGNLLAIAGKKTYALLSSDPKAIAAQRAKIASDPNARQEDHFCKVGGKTYVAIKTASKGVHLTPAQIVHVARGGMIEYPNPVPTFRLAGGPVFQKRIVRATAAIRAS